MPSPTGTQKDGEAVQPESDEQQHNNSGGGVEAEGLLRARNPVEYLDGQRRELV
ncbi:hypothetical protein [Hymenobacter sp. HDW8]|uniref:hypothetical protein n=1 Tax=Hymenobacter sp. HDW8 TaxID=2714932 RepID=UPI001F0FD2C6|nr:hypothetical protein [Hymenobacter sp. HDW8]